MAPISTSVLSPFHGKTIVLEFGHEINFKTKQELIKYLREQQACISYILTASVCFSFDLIKHVCFKGDLFRLIMY